ncbi:hypothetical protein BSR29_06920 [Boudabousia liubingyangii]|uniref:Sensor-like histidine kinase SenX3 n=1 Tax=Boudabousia liubingyangii TaxID=1921764 RepID=A0A1Q5PKC7_9ACTO|nr:hypothetical protein BSR29_06920 [Boudabousia liubingyangii]OKL47130.1 hypothetical protein BSR28_05370 [Boudabousia liubingyangii]
MGAIAALLGLIVGAGGVWAAWISEKARHESPPKDPDQKPRVEPNVLFLLAALPYVSVILDEDDRLVYADAAAFAQGIIVDEHIANRELAEIVEEVRAEGHVIERDLEFYPGRGKRTKTRKLLVRVAALGSQKILILAEDSAASRRLEKTRQDFTANVSHELKTPVGAISLLSETIADHADNPEVVSKFALKLNAEAHRLSVLIGDIIELTRLQAPDALAKPQLLNLNELAAEVVQSEEWSANQSETQLLFQPAQSEVRIWGDRHMLKTALRNLIENAIRYSPPRTSVGIKVNLVDGRAQVAVVDQGIGIPKDEQERIFERFYRVDAGRSRAAGGTGLGLSIVKHVVQNHGGSVKLWSNPEQGSTFTIILPEAEVGSGSDLKQGRYFEYDTGR